MTTLKTTKRNPEVKAKKLRRDGFATGVLYGREMDENIPLQFSAVDARLSLISGIPIQSLSLKILITMQ